MKPRSRRAAAGDRGATAVEFALLLPLLLLIVFGTIDFGRALNAQITLTQAAREGARVDAVGVAGQPATTAAVQSATVSAATGLNLSAASNVSVGYLCAASDGQNGKNASVAVSYSFSFITPVGALAGLFGGSSGYGSPITLTAQGVMPCET